MGEDTADRRIPDMSQRSFASAEYAMKKKRTRREKFLAEMETIQAVGAIRRTYYEA